MIIRYLKCGDLKEESFKKTLSEIKPISEELSKLQYVWRERNENNINQIILEENNTIVGTASYIIEYKYYNEGKAAMHVEDVAINPDFQKKGLGKVLMDEIIRIAKLEDCYKIILNCAEHNVAFYEKCGFHKSETQMRLDIRPA